MEFGKALKEIRANRDAEHHFQWILASLKKHPRRRLQVRALLAKSRTEWRRTRASHFAEMAGDILWTILKKPMRAEVVYWYALSIADDPLPSLMALFEIFEKQNRFDDAFEAARRIVEIASPLQSETIRERLQLMAPMLTLNFEQEMGAPKVRKRLQTKVSRELDCSRVSQTTSHIFVETETPSPAEQSSSRGEFFTNGS